MALIENPPKMSSLTLHSSIAEAWSRPGLQIDVWPLYLDNITGIKNSGNWTTGWSPPSHGLSGSHSFGPPPFFHCFSLSIDQYGFGRRSWFEIEIYNTYMAKCNSISNNIFLITGVSLKLTKMNIPYSQRL